MRPSLPVFIVLALLAAPAAFAAPTCLNPNGDTVRCERPGAMPVGWTPSPQQRLKWQMSKPPGPGASEVLKVVLGIGLLFALIALMPEFDGRRSEDWGQQDDEEQR